VARVASGRPHRQLEGLGDSPRQHQAVMWGRLEARAGLEQEREGLGDLAPPQVAAQVRLGEEQEDLGMALERQAALQRLAATRREAKKDAEKNSPLFLCGTFFFRGFFLLSLKNLLLLLFFNYSYFPPPFVHFGADARKKLLVLCHRFSRLQEKKYSTNFEKKNTNHNTTTHLQHAFLHDLCSVWNKNIKHVVGLGVCVCVCEREREREINRRWIEGESFVCRKL